MFDGSGEPTMRGCGMCIACRLEYSRQWAVRMWHESQCHDQNCFLTLTYNDQHLPEDKSVKKDDMIAFMKKLRNKLTTGCVPRFDKAMRITYERDKEKKNYGDVQTKKVFKKIRFFGCAEYGEEKGRPHYHYIIFGHDFQDKEVVPKHKHRSFGSNKWWKGKDSDYLLYNSKFLSDIWQKGFVTIGEVNYQSMHYVARYITKKITGKPSWQHYSEFDHEGNFMHMREPEFCLMSRMPGLGKNWFDKYYKDVYPKDFVTIEGVRHHPPKYYDYLFQKRRPLKFEQIKNKRKEKMELQPDRKRLMAKERYRREITKKLKRNIENEK